MRFYTEEIATKLNSVYPSHMVLKIFVDYPKDDLKQKYIECAEKHNNKMINNEFIDAGFDLFCPNKIVTSDNSIKKVLMDSYLKCAATLHSDTGKVCNTGYYLHPRSSVSKTNFRLANSTGIIDAGYRGHVMAVFDILPNTEYGNTIESGDRLVQICAPSLIPIIVEIVDSEDDLGSKTSRGTGGFGSTGK